MRKDLFVLGARLLGLWQLCGALVSFAYIIGEYIGYIRSISYSHEYNMLHFGVELFVGLFLFIRPYKILEFAEFLTPNEGVVQTDAGSTNEADSTEK